MGTTKTALFASTAALFDNTHHDNGMGTIDGDEH